MREHFSLLRCRKKKRDQNQKATTFFPRNFHIFRPFFRETQVVFLTRLSGGIGSNDLGRNSFFCKQSESHMESNRGSTGNSFFGMRPIYDENPFQFLATSPKIFRKSEGSQVTVAALLKPVSLIRLLRPFQQNR